MSNSGPIIDPRNALARPSRRDFLKLAGLGGVVFVSGFGLRSYAAEQATSSAVKKVAENGGDFYFVQLSDTHWRFEGPAVNPDAQGTLKKAVAAVNGPDEQPDFIVFTGDLTHTTDDAKVRRDRMAGFRGIVSGLKTKKVYYLAGEHDASLDEGEAFRLRTRASAFETSRRTSKRPNTNSPSCPW